MIKYRLFKNFCYSIKIGKLGEISQIDMEHRNETYQISGELFYIQKFDKQNLPILFREP